MSASTTINQYTVFKYIVVGDSGIGKSSITLRYVEDSFEDHSMPTIGIEFFIKHVEHDGDKIKLNIWDTAGQEKYRSITRSYYRLAIGCLLCFSLIDRTSFNNLKDHLRDLKQGCQENVQFVLVGTFLDKANDNLTSGNLTSDLRQNRRSTFASKESRFGPPNWGSVGRPAESLTSERRPAESLRQVTRKEAEQFANENNILYYEEVSAKTGENVNKVFDVLTELVYDNFYDDIINGKDGTKNLLVVEEINSAERQDGKERGWCCS